MLILDHKPDVRDNNVCTPLRLSTSEHRYDAIMKWAENRATTIRRLLNRTHDDTITLLIPPKYADNAGFKSNVMRITKAEPHEVWIVDKKRTNIGQIDIPDSQDAYLRKT